MKLRQIQARNAPGIFILAGLLACSPSGAGAGAEQFVIASTTSTQDSGLLDVLIPEFELDNPEFKAKVVAVGSGEAIDLGRQGDADVLLVHSPAAEKALMAEGLGVSRQKVMANDFEIAGPFEDHGRLRSAATAVDAFARIASSGAKFVSRGDESGTHQRELSVWAEGTDLTGEWYLESGQGMAATLSIASELSAYVFTDSASFRVGAKELDLAVLFEGDASLVNAYSVIPVRGAKHLEAGNRFAAWVTGKAGQAVIARFGVADYGSRLFEPAAGGA